jgi:hypothetical protein
MGDDEQQVEEQEDSVEEQDDGGAASARKQAEEVEEAKKEMHELEEGDPPENVEDWPSGRAKYLTYGGPEGTAGYDEGPTAKLGPSSLQHQEDGSVTIEGEEVDNPEDYKADEPVPGAPDRAKERASGDDGDDSDDSDDTDDRDDDADDDDRKRDDD